MNAGAYGKEMKDVVINTTYRTKEGEIKTITSKEQQFGYRHSIFCEEEGIVLETVLKLPLKEKEQILQEIKELMQNRRDKQPIEYPNAGSTFKRGTDFTTAKLIDEAGLKGYCVGGAEVSTKHAGFVINKNHATAKDVITIIQHVQETIKKKFGKIIETEIEIIGEE